MLKTTARFACVIALLGFASIVEAATSIEVVVRSGDQLGLIVKEYCGPTTSYHKVASDNGIKNPNLIFPGQVLTLKCESQLVATNDIRLAETPANPKVASATSKAKSVRAPRSSGASLNTAGKQMNPLSKEIEEYIWSLWYPAFGAREARKALAVSLAENKYRICDELNDPVAAKSYNGSRDHGIFQVNDVHRGRFPQYNVDTCEGNILVAFEVYKEARRKGRKGGWGPWFAHGNENYVKAMARYKHYYVEDKIKLAVQGDIRLASYAPGQH